MNLLDLVFRYRQLLAKTHAALGLTWDEIDLMSQVEGMFASESFDGRRFRRQAVCLPATMRGDGMRDPIAISELSPGGMICHGAPFVNVGDELEIIIELSASAAEPDDLQVPSSFALPRATSETEVAPGMHVRSYRFAGTVMWRRDDDDDNYTVGLAFIGIPVVVNYVTGEKLLNTDVKQAA